MPERLRIAEIGLGWVATNRHLPVMTASSEYDIVGVIDKRPDRAAQTAKKFGCRRYCDSEQLADPGALDCVPWLDEVEAVSIGASPFAHYGLIKSALNLGKHVITEKPFTMTVTEGEELVQLAKSQKRTLGIVHNFQFATSTQRMLSDLASGMYGHVRSVTAFQLGNPSRRLPDWYEDLPLGLFYDESPHLFYLVQRCAPGPLTPLRTDIFPSTSGRNTPAMVTEHCCADSPDGPIPVRVSLNFESPLSEWHVQVSGENFLGDVDVFRDIYLRLPNDGGHTARTIVRTSCLACWQHWTQHFPNGLKHFRGRMWYGNEEVYRRFVEAVRKGTQPENIGPEDALDVLRQQHRVIQHGHNLLESNINDVCTNL